MGVHGLWRLIEPSGKPVPVESLENKILAVDVSIWLHQAIKGFHDAKGAPALNAHLLGIFHRVCKLLYFKIKPVFVFDGGVPVLKRETIAKRNKLKHKNISEADKIQKQLLDTLIKHSAVNKVLGEKAKTQLASASSSRQERTEDDLFKLPKKELKSENNSEEDSSDSEYGSPTKNWNLHNIDTRSDHFKSLPADVRHEILTELKETRKQSSWGRLHELPTQSDDFSGFQMKRLLKRQEVQMALEEAEKEMGGHSLSLVELEELLKDQGVISKNDIGNRIASDENTRYLYIRDVKQALEKARREEEKKKLEEIKEEDEDSQKDEDKPVETSINKADLELEADIQKAIILSLQEHPSGSGQVKKKLSDFSFLDNFEDDDFESDSEEDSSCATKNTKLSSAQNYMMEYSGLSPNEIAKIIAENEKSNPKKRKITVLKEDTRLGQKENDDISEDPSRKKLKISNENDISNKLPGNASIILKEANNAESINREEDVKKKDFNAALEKNIDDEHKKGKDENIHEHDLIGLDNEESGSEESEDEFQEIEEIVENQERKIIDPNSEVKKSMEIQEEKIIVHADKIVKLDSSIGLISGSEESENDFEEVEEIVDNKMEIKIETEGFDEEDDLFADIFTTKDERIELDEVKRKIETIIPTIENKHEKTETQITKELNHKEEKKTELLEDILNKIESIKEKNDEKGPVDDLCKPRSEEKKSLSEKDLERLRDDLDQEEMELRNEQGLRERLGANITDQMYQEAQDLLELFGLPYVVAPMEAEAQCAFLEMASLTHGTITDDSDIWLFGGKTVYKNFFNQSKHVLEYRAEDIKHHFKLSREQMILLALLVGSDYTTGLQGVGPVTAMEILANFPPSSTSSFTLSHNQLLMGLNEFKSWFMEGKSIARGKNSLRNKLKNVNFIEGFPSMQVVQAYLNPTVDQSEEQFSWSKPDIVALIDFGRSKFGWSKIKTEDILKPVLKRMKEGKYQSTLLNYFKIKHDLNAEEAQKLMSERVRSAVKRIGQDPKDAEESDNSEEEKKNKKSKGTKTKSLKTKKSNPVEDLLSDDEFIEIDQIEAMLESVDKEKSKKRKKEVKRYKLLEQAEEKLSKSNEMKVIDTESEEDCQSNKKEPIPLLENKEMNLLIQVLSHQEPNNVENASKIAKVKKIAEKIKEVTNPELIEEKVPKSKQSKKDPKIKRKQEGNPKDDTAPSTSKKESNLMKLKRIKKKLEGKTVDNPEESKPIKRKKPVKASISKPEESVDEELQLLKETEVFSEKRMEDIKAEAEKMLQKELNKKKLIERKLHRKEIIPQKERAQKNLLNTRLRAIEVFRKTKIDPTGKKGVHKKRLPKEEAELSESSSDSDL